MSSPQSSSQGRILGSMGSVAVLFAAYVGLSVERISKETGISPTLLMDPETYLPEDFFEKFFNLVVREFPDRNIPLELAQLAPLSYFGTPGRLLLRAPDAQTMVEMFAGNSDLLADRLKIEVITSSNTEIFLCSDQPLDQLVNGISQEIGLGLGTRIVQDCFGEGLLTRVEFRHKARGALSAYEEAFHVPVRFQSDCNALVLNAKKLHMLNKRGRPETRSSLEQRLLRLRQELGLKEAGGDAGIRKAIMNNAVKGDYSVSGLARSLGMSLSTLQRRTPPDINVRKLLEETRYVNAMGMLADKRLSVDEVAFRLGFESDRGFRKAFKRWSGKTPTEARKEMQ
jgi:AraC-like DNA-binding protein